MSVLGILLDPAQYEWITSALKTNPVIRRNMPICPIRFPNWQPSAATFLSGITYTLLCTPHVLKKLTELVRDAFPFESDINIANVQQLVSDHWFPVSHSMGSITFTVMHSLYSWAFTTEPQAPHLLWRHYWLASYWLPGYSGVLHSMPRRRPPNLPACSEWIASNE